MAFSLMRGLDRETHVQKEMRMGNKVSSPISRPVNAPPPTRMVMTVGIPMSREANLVLEKLARPGPSAGNGGLGIAADYG